MKYSIPNILLPSWELLRVEQYFRSADHKIRKRIQKKFYGSDDSELDYNHDGVVMDMLQESKYGVEMSAFMMMEEYFRQKSPLYFFPIYRDKENYHKFINNYTKELALFIVNCIIAGIAIEDFPAAIETEKLKRL